MLNLMPRVFYKGGASSAGGRSGKYQLGNDGEFDDLPFFKTAFKDDTRYWTYVDAGGRYDNLSQTNEAAYRFAWEIAVENLKAMENAGAETPNSRVKRPEIKMASGKNAPHNEPDMSYKNYLEYHVKPLGFTPKDVAQADLYRKRELANWLRSRDYEYLRRMIYGPKK